MLNLVIALAAGIVVYFALWLSGIVPAWGAIFPALAVAVALYYFLARRVLRQLEALMKTAEKELLAARTDQKAATNKEARARYIDRAVKILEGGFAFARWQFFASSQIHSQMGVLLFVQDEVERALPHLEQSFARHWVARAMLAAVYARKKRPADMERVFEAAVKSNKKEPLLWALYAWCLAEAGQREKAIKASGRGAEINEADEKLKALHLALQNNERDKVLAKRMRAWGDEWYQFRFERHPSELMMATGGRRVLFQRK